MDTGIGLDAEEAGKLFEPFEQADASMTRRYGGSGLGLAVCRSLAEAMEGSLTISSKKGEGSTFVLAVPVEVQPEAGMLRTIQAEPARMAIEASPTGSRAGNVLLAEDGEDNQLLLSTLLTKWGFVPTLVADGQAAVDTGLRAWRAGQPFDLILMDMQMPMKDGYTATAELRAQGYKGAIVALTAHAMTGERERCIEAGCNDYLSKPLERQVFKATVERHVSAALDDRQPTDGVGRSPS
jgi:CheY-like chemotaxis protein